MLVSDLALLSVRAQRRTLAPGARKAVQSPARCALFLGLLLVRA